MRAHSSSSSLLLGTRSVLVLITVTINIAPITTTNIFLIVCSQCQFAINIVTSMFMNSSLCGFSTYLDDHIDYSAVPLWSLVRSVLLLITITINITLITTTSIFFIIVSDSLPSWSSFDNPSSCCASPKWLPPSAPSWWTLPQVAPHLTWLPTSGWATLTSRWWPTSSCCR